MSKTENNHESWSYKEKYAKLSKDNDDKNDSSDIEDDDRYPTKDDLLKEDL
jgi:broad specificity polyphosphatase/5'/3'-nucleotidase SurE